MHNRGDVTSKTSADPSPEGTSGPSGSFVVASLGAACLTSPLGLGASFSAPVYVSDDERVLRQIELDPRTRVAESETFEKAGPRERIYFDPKTTRVAIVSSGGLCPGTNNVIRSVVLELIHKYGVSSILGFRFGFAGLDPKNGIEPLRLDEESVQRIHTFGGTILGTSRGPVAANVMAETLLAHGIHILIAIGGDGTMAGVHALAQEITARGLSIAVVGIPKTIDNDISFIDKTFGFDTAVSIARTAIDAAHTEALSLRNGVGLVKLMGRASGFIAAQATIASRNVNVCLVPEVPFDIAGRGGLLDHLEQRLARRKHAVIVVAEGCGERLLPAIDGSPNSDIRDASGNMRFQSARLDIGEHLRRRISEHFAKRKLACTIKFIDPSYMIRGVPANAGDAVFCDALARHGVHAAMAGKTDMMIGRCHRVFTHVPLALVLSQTKRIQPRDTLWLDVLETTGQPALLSSGPLEPTDGTEPTETTPMQYPTTASGSLAQPENGSAAKAQVSTSTGSGPKKGTIAEIMSSNLLYVRAGTRVALARAHILDFGVSAAPVLDETHRPIGLVTLRDLANDAGGTFEPSGTVDTIEQDASIEEGARRLAETGCHQLVVVDDVGVAVGMVSSVDFVRAFVGLPPKHPSQLERFA